MTAVEFLHPIRNGSKTNLILAILYYAERYQGNGKLTVSEIKTLLKRGKVKKVVNIAQLLSQAAPHVDNVGVKGTAFLWSLTPTGQKHVRKLLGLPEVDVEIERDVSALNKLVDSINDPIIADYIKEAVTGLSVDARRAAVVFLWSGAIRRMQEEIIALGLKKVNPAIQKFDNKARRIGKIDDFAYVKDSTTLLAAQGLGIFDKNQRGILEESLDLRNKSGYPGKYKPGEKKVSSYIEDILNVVFK